MTTMKASELWKVIPKDVLVIFTVKDEIVAQMWQDEVDEPELLDREVLQVWAIENRVLGIEVQGGGDHERKED